MTPFEKLLADASKIRTRHNVIELRALYYGRLDIYVAFSNDGDIVESGYSGSTLVRPYGIECLPVNEVVGKHTRGLETDRYANVFRFKKNDVLDELSYTRRHAEDDIDVLMTLDYLDDDVINESINRRGVVSQVVSPFNYILEVTKDISLESGLSDRLQRRLLGDLGYDTIHYRNGKYIILDIDSINELDIIQYETFRPEERSYVRRSIDKKNRKMWVQRNRYSKIRTPKNRKPVPDKGRFSDEAKIAAIIAGVE